jgi:hypothetical protein
VIRALHSLAAWALIVLGLVVGACCAALWSPIGGVIGAIIDLIIGVMCAWIGWRLAGAPTLHLPIEETHASWDALGDAGLWRGDGCALGAVDRHVWSSWHALLSKLPSTLYHPLGHRLMLGAAADDAFLAASSLWRHALIYVDTRGTSDRLDRDDVVRFAPGRVDTVRLNPLLMIRRGIHAWRDAYILASGLMGAGAAAGAIATLAAVLLDHLHTAAPEERTLAAVRRRLIDHETALIALVHAVHVKGGDGVWRSDPEIARLARIWKGDPPLAREHLATAAQALVGFQDGRLAEATAALDVRLADAATGGPRTIILEAPPGDAARYAPFFTALLGQLVTQLTDAVETDVFGRRKTRRVLVAIDDPALIGQVPMLAQRIAVATRCGLELLVRSDGIEHAVRLIGGAGSLDAYHAIAAIGPQDAGTAAKLSAHAKTRAVIRLRASESRHWRGGPVVDVAAAPRLAAVGLECAGSGETNILMADQGLIRGRSLDAPRGRLRLSAEARKPPHHDWAAAAAPVVEGKALRAQETPTALPLFEGTDKQEAEVLAPDRSEAVGKKLRAGLARGARSRRA